MLIIVSMEPVFPKVSALSSFKTLVLDLTFVFCGNSFLFRFAVSGISLSQRVALL